MSWNARGLKSNVNDLKNEINTVVPDVIALQEYYIHKPKQNKGVSIANYCKPILKDEHRLGTYFRDNIEYKEITIEETIPAQCFEIYSKNSKYTLINVYLKPKLTVDEYNEALHSISKYIKNKTIIMGDFNARHESWDSITNNHGNALEEWMDKENLVLINNGQKTHINPIGRDSLIDLTIISPSLYADIELKIGDSPLGSDHFPQIATLRIDIIKNEIKTPPRWLFDKANWEEFRLACDQITTINIENNDINVYFSNLQEILIKAANTFIPKTKPNGNKFRNLNPWWDLNCKHARKEKFRALKKYINNKNEINHNIYKKAQSYFKKVTRQAQLDNWREFCATLNNRTPIGNVWKKIKAIRGKGKIEKIPVLDDAQNKHAITNREKANLIAKTFAIASSNENHTDEFKLNRRTMESNTKNRNLIDNAGPTDTLLNQPFTLEELKTALSAKKNSAPGDDKLAYAMFKQMTNTSLGVLLEFFNKSWEQGVVPDAWKSATVIPIPKPNKPKSAPTSYRPISLTSNVCKIFETMVNNRLIHHLDENNILSKHQSGFRKNRSTLDQILTLEHDIKLAHSRKQELLAVFLDLEKAFDLMWHEGVLLKLKKYGVTGKMYSFVKSFLSNRKIKVRVNDTMSEEYDLENGSPQGSVISPTLFNIAINELEKTLAKATNLSQFADDGCIWASGKHLSDTIKKIQNTLDRVHKWANTWGFKLSQSKTVAMIFSKFNKPTESVKLTMNGKQLEFVKLYKFLGLLFDRKLSWTNHIDKLVSDCQAIINLMRCTKGNKIGSDKKTLNLFYTSYMQSKLDYGCQAYNSASEAQKAKLDIIHRKALRVILSALKCTPINNLYVEAGQKPLQIRRDELILRYWARIKPLGSKLSINSRIQYSSKKRGKRFENATTPYTVTLKHLLKTHKIDSNSQTHETPNITPWAKYQYTTDDSLSLHINKSTTNPVISKILALEHIDKNYNEYTKIYTDGSKCPDSGKTGYSVFIPDLGINKTIRTNDNLSVYSTEMIAILTALAEIHKNKSNKLIKGRKIVILTDSLSSVTSIRNKCSSRPDLLKQILTTIGMLTDFKIAIVWIPSHVNITGNEKADELAKNALDKQNIDSNILLGKSEIYSLIRQRINKHWQNLWDTLSTYWSTKLNIETNHRLTIYNSSLRKDKIIGRIRMGTTLLPAHCTIQALTGCSQNCNTCGTPEDIEHVIFYCPNFNIERTTMYKKLKSINITDPLNENILGSTSPNTLSIILSFISDIGYEHKI